MKSQKRGKGVKYGELGEFETFASALDALTCFGVLKLQRNKPAKIKPGLHLGAPSGEDVPVLSARE